MKKINKKLSSKFEEVLLNYLTTAESEELIQKLLSSEDELKSLNFDDIDKEFTGKEFRRKRTQQIESIITLTKNKLGLHKFLDLLISSASVASSIGEFSYSENLYNFVIKSVSKNKNLFSLKASAYLGLGEIYFRQAYWNKSISSVNKANRVYSEEKHILGMINCENIKGAISGDKGNLKKAKDHFLQCIDLLDEKKDKFLRGVVDINLGIINYAQNQYDEAIVYLFRALTTFEQVGAYKIIAQIRYNLGVVFMLRKEFDSALTELNLSIESSLKAEYLPTICFAYLSRANIYQSINDLNLALIYADKSLEISYDINDRLSIADTYKVKGLIQRKMNNFELAENYLLTSLRMNEELENQYNHSESSFELGLLYREWEKNSESLKYLKNALSYKKKINASEDVNKIESIISQLN